MFRKLVSASLLRWGKLQSLISRRLFLMLLNFLAEKKHSATDQTFLVNSQKLSRNAKVLIFWFDLVLGILADLTCKQ